MNVPRYFLDFALLFYIIFIIFAEQLFDHCSVDADCRSVIDNSICLNNTCRCFVGYSTDVSSNTCERLNIGDQCSNDVECTYAINGTTCANGTCQCNIQRVRNGDLQECRRRRFDDACSDDVHCRAVADDSFCTNRTCACSTGYRLQRFETLEGNTNFSSDKILWLCMKRIIDDNCDVDDDCQIDHSRCGNLTCHCLPGFYTTINGTKCERRIIYDSCKVHTDCSFAMENSFCSVDGCACQTGYYVTSGNTTCSRRHVGDTCNSSLDCSSVIEQSNCLNETCVCNDGYVRSNNGSTCIQSKYHFISYSTFYQIMRAFHRIFATGVACRQGMLTPPDTWSCPFSDLQMFYVFRPATPFINDIASVCDILPDLKLLLIKGLNRAYATGVTCLQGTRTSPNTWFRPILDLHMFYLLRPILFLILSLFFRTMLFEHLSVLSPFGFQIAY